MSNGDFKPGPDPRRSHAGLFKPGHDPRRAPGGKPSLQRDLERAGALKPELAGLTPEHARAQWWAMILPIAFAGPQGAKDTNWVYASGEVGVRLLGKPKETIELQDGTQTPIDWTLVPEDRRPALMAMILELQGYLGTPSDTEH